MTSIEKIALFESLFAFVLKRGWPGFCKNHLQTSQQSSSTEPQQLSNVTTATVISSSEQLRMDGVSSNTSSSVYSSFEEGFSDSESDFLKRETFVCYQIILESFLSFFWCYEYNFLNGYVFRS
jgi:hypothetical protein